MAREEVMNEFHVSNIGFVSLLLKSLHQTAKLVHRNKERTYLFKVNWNCEACTLFLHFWDRDISFVHGEYVLV